MDRGVLPLNGLMQYLDDQPSGADKYHGAIATGYDEKREGDAKWQVEQAVIMDMLGDLPKGSWVLDIPCGTGRFFEFYRDRGFLVRAVDRSEDMLNLAVEKVAGYTPERALPKGWNFGLGDVRSLDGMADQSSDAAVMCRLTRWLSPSDCIVAFRELMRVTRKRVIFTARVRNHPHARPYELIYQALHGTPWRVARDEAGYVEDYRIIALEPA